MDWRLLILRISKFICAGLVLLHIILTVTSIGDWKAAIIWVYEILFCAMLLGNVFGWVAQKISLVTRYMQFMHKNIGYGFFVIFIALRIGLCVWFCALLALATPLGSNINFINLALIVLGVLQIMFGIFYLNSVFEDAPPGGSSSPGKKAEPEKESIKKSSSTASPQPAASTPGTNKVPPPVF